ncbi:disease resistance protein RGA2-like [Oryza glaberrima]|uniref:AAA+ ATPase domain-containing protein n=1 Tax=Oryza glaberrima TaxID=4538 RepID=I1QMT2_ORYGL|nr:disease resistance protein RGA2-like [Oryza glaberrima]
MAVRRAPLLVGPRAAADGNPAPPGESSKGPGLDGEFRRLVDIADEGVKLVNDAELRLKKRACDNPKDLAAWLRRLQSAKEDLDDALDEFRASMAAQRRRPELEDRKKSIRHWFSHSSANHEVDKKMKITTEKLNKKFHGILQNGRELGLQPIKLQRQSRISEFPGDLSPQYTLVGDIEQEKLKLINKLTGSESTSAVIAIFGLGGIGKTMLARKVHDDLLTESAFSTVVWVNGSKSFTKKKLLRAILSSSGGKPGEAKKKSNEQIEDMLVTILGAKKFLLVLDDVWADQIHQDFLKVSLQAQQGSRILLTTQDEGVLRQIASDDIHKVNKLSFPDCWSLLCSSACLDEQDCDALTDIGITIIQKCNKVPLAIKVLGGLLGTKNPRREEWQEVISESEGWTLENVPDGMEEICLPIYLAYYSLPYHLKLCFDYCLQLPEGFVIRPQIVTQLWIAEGFIREQDNRNPEDIAEQYYKELVLRNLLQPEIGCFDMSKCTVHDCVKSLLQPSTKDKKSTDSTEGTKFFRSFRTAFVYKNPSGDRGLNWLINLRSFINLRSLDLTGTCIRYIPKSLEHLHHLRLLNLSLTQVLELPESIESLSNLQFLILRCCYWLETLPEEISNLVSLRSLDLEGTTPHIVLSRLSALEQLTALHGFIVDHNAAVPDNDHQNGWPMKELSPLNSLRSLQIMGIDRVPDESRAQEANLASKSHLTHLELCGSSTSDSQVFVPEEEQDRWLSVLCGLQPPQCLEYLKIASYYGSSLPDWILQLRNLQRLVLTDCKLCDSLPALGQLQQLKFLTINGCPKLRIIEWRTGATTKLVFPKLEQLDLSDMQALESLDRFKHGDLLSLTKFHLENSPKLRSLPSGLGYCKVLTSMKIVGADSLQVIDNLPMLKELVVQDCRELVKISNLPVLQVLVVVDCSMLQDLRGVGDLRHVRLVDRVTKELPDWLTGHEAPLLQTFTIVGTTELLRKLVPNTKGWSAIRNMDRVYANLPDGAPFLAYNKGKPDFQMIKTIVSPQLEDPSADVILGKLVRMASQTGLADTVKRYFLPPLAIALVFLLLVTRDFTLIGVFLAFFAACVAGFSVIYIQKTSS